MSSHCDTRKDSARLRGRAKKGKRAFARQFLSGDGKLWTIMGVMTMNGMEVEACGFLVRLSRATPGCLPLVLCSLYSRAVLSLSSCIYLGTHLLFPARVLTQRSRL